MFRNLFQNIESTNTLSIVGMLIFFFIFLAVIYYVVTLDKKREAKYSAIPLEDNELTNNNNLK
jgi:cbb3-type cytochrome oxidase subunit 3